MGPSVTDSICQVDNIKAVTDPISTKLFGPNVLGSIFIWTQKNLTIFFGPKFFGTTIFCYQVFLDKNFLGQNVFGAICKMIDWRLFEVKQHKYKLVLGWVTIWWVVLLIQCLLAYQGHNIKQEPNAVGDS